MPRTTRGPRYSFKRIFHELVSEQGKKAEISQKTGFPHSTIRGWAAEGGSLPTIEEAYDIANALGVSLEYLVTGEKTEVKDQNIVMSDDLTEAVDLLQSLPPELRSIAIAQIRVLAASIGTDDSSKHKETG